MPTYQYACTACDERLEAVQTFTDAPLMECPACGGRLRKVFSAVGVVFKGSGFYKTDSRDGKKPAAAKAGSEGAAASTSSSDSGSGSGSDSSSSSSSGSGASSTPAAAASAASSTSSAPVSKTA